MPISIEQTQQIWSSMLDVNHRGQLRWKPEVGHVCTVPQDPRLFPERFIAMTPLYRMSDYEGDFTLDGLIQRGEFDYVAPNGESTGIDGLLKFTLRFPIANIQPESMLVVGSFNINGILSSKAWLKENNFDQTQLNVIDPSNLPLEVVRRMMNEGYISEDKINLRNVNFFNQTLNTKQYDLIVGDGLNLWMVDDYETPRLTGRSPYQNYENYLARASKLLFNDGVFFSRCILRQNDPTAKSNVIVPNMVEDKVDMVCTRIGDSLTNQLDKVAMGEVLEEMFEKPSPPSYCGLEYASPLYQSIETQTGSHAEEVFERLHRRNFKEVHMIRVIDPKFGYTHLNFACKN